MHTIAGSWCVSKAVWNRFKFPARTYAMLADDACFACDAPPSSTSVGLSYTPRIFCAKPAWLYNESTFTEIRHVTILSRGGNQIIMIKIIKKGNEKENDRSPGILLLFLTFGATLRLIFFFFLILFFLDD